MRLKAEANWIGKASTEEGWETLGAINEVNGTACLGSGCGGKREDGRRVEVMTRMSEYAALFAPAGHDLAGTK
ncbi:hypothetical protein CF120_11320 [Aeromonas allosaccharophila]|nr:hypothetical protein CF120_11320 [Aeromonas allosaccharophila]